MRNILIPLGVLVITLQVTNPDPAILHVHQTLSAFLRRGQISIELFPPLSLYLGAYSTASTLAYLSYAAHAGMSAIIGQALLAPAASGRPRLVVLTLSLLGALGMKSTLDPVTLSNEWSDLFLVAAAASAFIPYALPALFFSVSGEVWVVMAAMFRWTNNEPLILFVLLLLRRFITALIMLNNTSVVS